MNTEAAPAGPFPYKGAAELQKEIVSALQQVVDPEVALSVVDLGLIYGVEIGDKTARVTMTMTSAACPVADVIMDDVEAELERVLQVGCRIAVDLVWEPAWTPEMMSQSARRFMG
ncbi:MAG: metal-sulfur cluster assembly factor [Burkholderiales bacterium]